MYCVWGASELRNPSPMLLAPFNGRQADNTAVYVNGIYLMA
jgi:hypothetical protein